MYVSPELRERLEPAVIGWRSHRGWRHTDSLHHGLPEFKSEAEKYEGGMLTFTVLYAMGASIELLLEIGPEQIEARVLRLAQCVRQIMQSAGGRPLPHSGSSIVVARFPKDGLQLVSSLRAQGVQVAARYGNLRVSPHFYNDESDLDRFAEALERSL